MQVKVLVLDNDTRCVENVANFVRAHRDTELELVLEELALPDPDPDDVWDGYRLRSGRFAAVLEHINALQGAYLVLLDMAMEEISDGELRQIQGLIHSALGEVPDVANPRHLVGLGLCVGLSRNENLVRTMVVHASQLQTPELIVATDSIVHLAGGRLTYHRRGNSLRNKIHAVNTLSDAVAAYKREFGEPVGRAWHALEESVSNGDWHTGYSGEGLFPVGAIRLHRLEQWDNNRIAFDEHHPRMVSEIESFLRQSGDYTLDSNACPLPSECWHLPALKAASKQHLHRSVTAALAGCDMNQEAVRRAELSARMRIANSNEAVLSAIAHLGAAGVTFVDAPSGQLDPSVSLSTLTVSGTAKKPGRLACALLGYHPAGETGEWSRLGQVLEAWTYGRTVSVRRDTQELTLTLIFQEEPFPL